MNKRFQERFDSWDLKSFFLTLFFLSLGIFLYLYFWDIRDWLRTGDKENFNGLTVAKVISIEPIQRITQSKWKGTKIFIDSYKVTYRFAVNGQTFENTDNIPVTTANEKLLTSLLEVRLNPICSVKYDLKEPKKSILFESD